MYKTESKPNGNIWIGIGIDISPNDSAYPLIIKLNETLKHNYGSSYLFSYANPPHLNLYDIDIPQKYLEKVCTSLEQIVGKWKHFPVKLASIDCFKHGAVYIQCDLSEQLRFLEMEVVEALSDYRENSRTEDYWQPWREYNQQQIDNRNKYGNPYVLNTFNPHITLGYIGAELFQAVQQAQRSFTPVELHVKQISMAIQNSNGEFVDRRHFMFA